MTEDKKQIKVSAAVMQKDGKFFVAKRKSDKPTLAGFWEFPGGKIESEESPEECLRRELREEFDIDTEIFELLINYTHDYDFAQINFSVFRVEHLSGDFIPSDHDEMRWLELSEFDQYEFAPADYPIIDHLKNLGF